MANAWVNREHIDLYLDRSRNARFSFYQYAVAFRQVQNWYFDQYCMDEKRLKDSLYTLIKRVSPAITTTSSSSTNDLTINHINYPSDYDYFLTLLNYIGGNPIESTPINHNQINNILIDSFRKPSNERCYILEDSTGWRIYRGFGGAYTNELTYLISPSEWSIGTEDDLIDAAITAVLTSGVNYTATADTVYLGNNYEAGEQFNATSTVLTSGQVIPTSVLVDSNFPDSTQNELCRRTALLLQGSVKDAFGVNFTSQIGEQDQK